MVIVQRSAQLIDKEHNGSDGLEKKLSDAAVAFSAHLSTSPVAQSSLGSAKHAVKSLRGRKKVALVCVHTDEDTHTGTHFSSSSLGFGENAFTRNPDVLIEFTTAVDGNLSRLVIKQASIW